MPIYDAISIPLFDGSTITPSQLKAGVDSGKEYFAFGIDSYGDIGISKVKKVTKSKDKVAIVQIVLASGGILGGFGPGSTICKMSNQSAVPGSVDGLKAGDSLYPLARLKDGEGNEFLVWQKESKVVSISRLADFYNVGNDVYTDEPTDLYYPTHIDGNKSNNSPSNIKRLTPEEAGIKPIEKKSIFEIEQAANKLYSVDDRPPDLASLHSKNKSVDPNYYLQDDRTIEATQRFKLAEKKRMENLKSDPVTAPAISTSYVVDLVEPMPDPESDYVYSIETETGNFAIQPGLFLQG